jgi:hypothetical protein
MSYSEFSRLEVPQQLGERRLTQATADAASVETLLLLDDDASSSAQWRRTSLFWIDIVCYVADEQVGLSYLSARCMLSGIGKGLLNLAQHIGNLLLIS